MRTALNLWLIVLGGLALYGFSMAPAVAAGTSLWLALAGIPLVYGAVFAVCVTIYSAIAWLNRAPRPPQARIGLAATLRLLFDEYRALVISVPRMMAYRLVVPEPRPASAEHPVLLVHGVLCNAGVWAGVRRVLLDAGLGPVYAISYGPPLAGIDRFAEQLARRIDDVLARTGARQVTIVAHSMGGLVTLAYCRRHGPAKVARVVTLGTPFHGSMHAWMVPGVDMAQMRPGNAWLSALHADGLAGLPPIVSLWSWHDTMVAPQTSSRLDGAGGHAFVGIGHNALLGNAEVRARLLEELARRDPPGAAAAEGSAGGAAGNAAAAGAAAGRPTSESPA